MYAALLTKSMCSETCIPSHTSCMSNKAGYGDDERIFCQIHLAYIFADEFWKTLSHNVSMSEQEVGCLNDAFMTKMKNIFFLLKINKLHEIEICNKSILT